MTLDLYKHHSSLKIGSDFSQDQLIQWIIIPFLYSTFKRDLVNLTKS